MPTQNSPDSEQRRRILHAIGVGSMASVAGCSSENTDSGGTETTSSGGSGGVTELSWSHWNGGEEAVAHRGTVKAFNEQYADISAEFINIPGAAADEYDRTIRTRVGGGQAPELMSLQPEATYPALASNGHLENLVPLIEDDDEFSLDDFYQGLIDDLYRWDEGEIYALPSQSSSIAMYYNQDAWEDSGITAPPETWSAFRDTLQTLKDDGVETPYFLPFQQSITKLFYQFAWQNGGNITNQDDTECVIASEENIEALEFINGLIEDGLVRTSNNIDAPWYGLALADSVSGTTATAGGPWVHGVTVDKGVDDQITAAPLPTPSNGEQACVANSHATAINSHKQDKVDDAFELLKWVTKEDYPKRRLDDQKSLPAVKGYEDHETMQEVPEFKTHIELLDSARAFYFGPETKSMVEIIVQQLQGVYTGSISPQEGLENAETQINDQLLG